MDKPALEGENGKAGPTSYGLQNLGEWILALDWEGSGGMGASEWALRV